MTRASNVNSGEYTKILIILIGNFNKKSNTCTNCGNAFTKGNLNVCPAKELICNICKNKGRFGRLCKSKGRRSAKIMSKKL